MQSPVQFNEYVRTVTVLKRFPNRDAADKLLKTIAVMVKPLMRAHGWRLPHLREFVPTNACLHGLNINAGAEIRLRLRPNHDPLRLFDFDYVMGTMLHELTHNVYGPHDAKFYAFMDKLQDEYSDLVAKGWKGEGFYAPGFRVGQGVSHDLSPHLAKERAALAAQKRAQTDRIMIPVGGRKLGGGSGVGTSGLNRRGMTPGQLAALAAERRAKDTVWCGSNKPDEQGKNSQGIVAAIDVDGEDEQTSAGQTSTHAGPSSSSSSTSSSTASRPGSSYNPIVIVDTDDDQTDDEQQQPSTSAIVPPSHLGKRKSRSLSSPPPTSEPTWTCSTCTLINRPLALQCDACWKVREHAKPVPPEDVRRPPSATGGPQMRWRI
ncbi:hypothetical protein HKX48_000320 [Thoreauomyces humboldtii]|nr:hypothetical protein HKX48_000320 [Thoreauomyces humboldtii]